MNINDILILMAEKLNINKELLFNSINSNISTEDLNMNINDEQKIEKINKLLSIDSKFVEFEHKLSNESTKSSFNKLKENMGQLQILILIKGLSKSKSCDDIINTLLNILNSKFSGINDILKYDLEQTNNIPQLGGSYNNDHKYYNKYIKYKIKYLKLNI